METRGTNNIKVLAFDLGRVLFDFDYNIALNKIKDRITVPAEDIIHALFHENFTDDFERGLVSPEDFYLKFKEKTGLSLSYEEFVPVWSDIFIPKKESISLVRSLRRHYKVFLISNINVLHYRFLKERFGEVFSLFDAQILSFEVKQLKPSKQIYDILLEKAEARPDELVYIDDRADLISQAREQGLNCIQFRDIEQCARELEGFGCLVP